MKIGCFEITYVGFKPSTWKEYARCGTVILAIKALREEKNKNFPSVDDPRRMGLREAKDTVDAYMRKRGIKAL